MALIVLNPDSLYYGGYFKAKMTFSKNYPYSPPGTALLAAGHARCTHAPSMADPGHPGQTSSS